MLLPVIVALIAVAVGVGTWGRRVPWGAGATRLGWMSNQWLAEHRASDAS